MRKVYCDQCEQPIAFHSEVPEYIYLDGDHGLTYGVQIKHIDVTGLPGQAGGTADLHLSCFCELMTRRGKQVLQEAIEIAKEQGPHTGHRKE